MPVPAGTTTLVTLDAVKSHLNIDASNTDNDAELLRFIARATPVIENIAGPVLPRTITAEQHIVSSGVRLALFYRPVLSVTSIIEYLGQVSYTVTVAADPTATGTYGATLDPLNGVLTRWTSGTPRDWLRNVYVTYIAGRDTVPDNIEEAALEQIRHMWDTQRGGSGRPAPGLDPETGTPVIAGVLSPRVIEMLGDDQRLDGFA